MTINAPDDWKDHAGLYEQGFGDYAIRTILDENQILGQAEVIGGEGQSVHLIAGECFSYALTRQEQPRILLPQGEFVYAPVVEGADAGYAYVVLGEKTIGKIPLIYGETIEREMPQKEESFLQRIFGG